jgi:peptide deformylase
MTIHEVLSIGHPVLRQRASEVPVDQVGSPQTQQLIDDLIDTMHHAHGAGIAANQIGVTQRICVLEVNNNPRYPYKPKIPLTVAINPQVETPGTETFINNEGCLSVPLRGDVERFTSARISYLDRHGDKQVFDAHGLTAATWQHEVDHLNGVLFIDKAEPATLTTWEEFETHHRAAFLERIAYLQNEWGT